MVKYHLLVSVIKINDALMMTADRRDQPDNLYDWGVVDAQAALQYQQKGDVTGDDMVDKRHVIPAADIALAK